MKRAFSLFALPLVWRRKRLLGRGDQTDRMTVIAVAGGRSYAAALKDKAVHMGRVSEGRRRAVETTGTVI